MPVRASRITYVGELGWELYIPTEFLQNVFDAIVAGGGAFGLKHAGYHALNSLRIEKAYRHWGHDIGPDDDPIQAGLGFWSPGRKMAASSARRRSAPGAASSRRSVSSSSRWRATSRCSTTTSRSGATASRWAT
jgi:glycine cleavage system aminomethyltransferase T